MGLIERGARPTRVVVVTDDDATTVADCLDGVAAQGLARVDVVVVDLCSTDGSADVAIRHGVPGRVAVAMPGDLNRIVEIGAADAPNDRLVLIGADQRPDDGWLDAALAELERHPVVLGEDRHRHHLAVDRSRVGHLDLPTDDPVELCRRVRAAGATLGIAAGMSATAAAPLAATGTGLPVLAPPRSPERLPGLVSVVLCTRDRPDHLARCMASLEKLDDHDHEIIVVDNHDRPTVDASLLPVRARVVHEPRQGLDVARNRGVAEAAGSVVAYVDDDCEVDPHWLTALRVGFADRQVQAVTGRVRPASLAAPSQRWFEAHFSFDRGPVPQRFTPWDRRPWYPMWSGGVGAGCNMAFRRDELLAAGGFDEALDMGTRIGGGGDLDAFVRLLDRGSIIAYQPDALVWHHHRATERDVTRQFFGYGLAVGALLAKSVLLRPRHRLTAVRFFLDRLRVGVRLARASRAGAHVLPVRLVAVDVLGQLVGPLVYLAVRRRAAGGP